jgi:hypothetical protein
MLGGLADDETVKGFQLHATPGHQIVMQGGEAAWLYGLRQGQGSVLGGTGQPSASATAHTSATRQLKAAQATSTVRISPIGSRTAAVRPACADEGELYPEHGLDAR